MNFSEQYAALGLRVANARRALGLSQEALGARADLSRATIASIEAGRQKVALDQLYALAAALEITDISQLVPLEVPDSSEQEIPTGFDLNPIQTSQISDLVRSALASARGGSRRRG
jgi:transcriptional regulator with XRE-family HTH domain